ncbi:MAG: PEP-CTERM sorting domain-containing protein [Kiritimatiellales bacterium]
MNRIKRLLFVGTYIFNLLVWPTTADVIVGKAQIIYIPGLDYNLLISRSGGGLGIILDEQGGGNYNFDSGLIAGEFSLYGASSGMEFNPTYADTQTPLVSNNGIDSGTSLQSFLLGETKYYAFWEDVFSGGGGDKVDNADNYGWVSLTYNGSALVVTDSATALGGGIIVGTYTQIPEPATVLLFGLGGFGAWLLRRNKQHQDELE